MRRILAAGALLTTMACTTAQPDDGTAEIGSSDYRCSADRLADLVGQAATQELGAQALRRSGSRTLRWIRPGDVVTMDYRPDRLNVRLDGRGNVESFGCG